MSGVSLNVRWSENFNARFMRQPVCVVWGLLSTGSASNEQLVSGDDDLEIRRVFGSLRWFKCAERQLALLRPVIVPVVSCVASSFESLVLEGGRA